MKEKKCGNSFNRSEQLRTHVKAHSGEKPFKCTQCDYASVQSSTLRRHMKTHTGEKPHKCNQCDYASAYHRHLKKYLKIDSGEKQHDQPDYDLFPHETFKHLKGKFNPIRAK